MYRLKVDYDGYPRVIPCFTKVDLDNTVKHILAEHPEAKLTREAKQPNNTWSIYASKPAPRI